MDLDIKLKNRFFYRLMLYFAILLLFFSISIGGVFSYLFIRNTINLNKKSLETRALKISEILSNGPRNRRVESEEEKKLMEEFRKIREQMPNSMIENERRINMRFIEDIGMAEVWYVDAKTGEILQGNRQINSRNTSNKNITPTNYSSLPPNSEQIVALALQGKTTTTENFNDFLNRQSITVATPIFEQNNKSNIVGVVLLHSAIDDITTALSSGIYTIIFSIIIALIIAVIIVIILSLNFTKPLNKIWNTALALTDGDYTAKTGVKQKDEIGVLANSIDILSDKLQKSSEESKRFEKMRNDFITNISHELRTPITVIRGSIEAICDDVITDKDTIKEFNHQILSDSIHLQNLVNDLIDLTKLQNPDFSTKKEIINLLEVILDATRSMKQLANKKNITLILKGLIEDNNYSTSKDFLGDYQRIRQLIIILLDNAIKFSFKNSKIIIDFRENDNNYLLYITDYGIGISKENINNIFDRFHKSKNSKNKEGVGLGLAIANQIAIRHNINLSVESIPNTKTTFTIKFNK